MLFPLQDPFGRTYRKKAENIIDTFVNIENIHSPRTCFMIKGMYFFYNRKKRFTRGKATDQRDWLTDAHRCIFMEGVYGLAMVEAILTYANSILSELYYTYLDTRNNI
jgi:hypothetical protein